MTGEDYATILRKVKAYNKHNNINITTQDIDNFEFTRADDPDDFRDFGGQSEDSDAHRNYVQNDFGYI